jgi:hypothetical protein
MSDFEMVPVAPVITASYFAFTFQSHIIIIIIIIIMIIIISIIGLLV